MGAGRPVGIGAIPECDVELDSDAWLIPMLWPGARLCVVGCCNERTPAAEEDTGDMPPGDEATLGPVGAVGVCFV